MGKIVCFEGADNCGKTTMLGKVKTSLLKDGHSVATFKTPDYEGVSGSSYGNHVKQMLQSNQKSFMNKKFLREFAYAQIDDKHAAIKYILESAESHDYLLIDRYILSTFVYDTAMLASCGKNKVLEYAINKDAVSLEHYRYDGATSFTRTVKCYDNDHRKKILNMVKLFKDILYIVCDKNESNLFFDIVGQNRSKQDELDTYDVAQTHIRALYSNLRTNPTRRKYFNNGRMIGFNAYVRVASIDLGLRLLHRREHEDSGISNWWTSSTRPDTVKEITKQMTTDLVKVIYDVNTNDSNKIVRYINM
jgi:hypothetical protein